MIKDLQDLIKVPSVSARKQNLIECAKMVMKIMEKTGIKSELLYLIDENGNKLDVPPIVYGEILSKKNPDAKTLLFYNHYDVQPEDPVGLWKYPPFDGVIENNYIFGRGASDDKGELITRINAVESFLKEDGDIPCNVKFIVEGEEEIGSRHIEQYLSKFQKKFRCDGIIWEFGYIDENDRPIISLGMKGLLYVELIAHGPSRDVHSSLAVLIENPAWKLIKLLDTLQDKNGKILIKNWYDDINALSEEELNTISNEYFNEESFKKEYGITQFIDNKTGINIKKALVGNPSCNIAGLISGYTGDGAKTIIPSTAMAKIDFRLVPNMNPQKQFQLLKNHLVENGYSNDIELKMIHGEAAARTSLNDPFVKKVEDSAKEIYDNKIVKTISSPGTGPMHAFNKILNVPSVSIGSTHVFSKIHSPNEYARIDLLIKTTKCIKKIMEKMAI
ncbi:MAG: acetylornithine deacetylase [Nitrososphaeraceae archaeon]|nr:acetylornithine deacetylase [Nitrososphaeraceae archaeon]